MAGISQDISIQVNNSLNRKATVTLLGGTQDPSNGQANAKTLYEWDLSAETFSNTTVVEIQASTVTNPEVITYTAVNQDGEVRSLQTVLNLLNTLNLGTFNLDGNTIFIVDDINIFGEISVKVSQNFDIDIFVESAYNYFDSEGKTTLASFSTTYKPLIEQAVNTIPTFVEFIETQGWSLAYVLESGTVRINRSQAGDIYHIDDTFGTLTTTLYSGTDNINSNGIQKSLLFVTDITLFENLNLFEARALTSVQSIIYKYVFNGNLVNFTFDSGVVNGWKPLSPNYFPNPLNLSHIIYFSGNTTSLMDLFGNSFPSVNLTTNANINFIGADSGTGRPFLIGALGQDAELNFGSFNNTSQLKINSIESLNNIINLNFATVNLLNLLNITLRIDVGETSLQTLNIDSSFNTLFTGSTDVFGDEFTIRGKTGTSNAPTIQYDDDTTPIVLNFESVDFQNSYTENLPPIQQLGKFDSNGGGGAPLTFDMDLDIRNQNYPSNISMRYMNNWFFKVGTQESFSQPNSIAGQRVIDARDNTFLICGTGIQGYGELVSGGSAFVDNNTFLTGGILSFTVRPSSVVTIQTQTSGLGQSDFEITYSEDGQTDTVQASSFFAINQEQLIIPSSSNSKNVLMTQRPSLDTTSFNIGSIGFTDQFSTFYFTSTPLTTELFNFPTQQIDILVNGLTLDMPVFDLAENEVDIKGLFQRDFSQAYGGTNAEFTISQFKINGTKFANGSVIPFPNGRAIFNFPTGTDRIDEITITESEFGTVYTNNLFGKQNSLFSDNFLEMLFGDDAIAQNGINIINTNFNGVDDSLTYLEVPIHLASLYNGSLSVQGLSGDSRISNVQFSQTQPDRLLFQSDWDGTGFPLNTLRILGNTNLQQINLQNTNTATPNALTMFVTFNTTLEVFNFTNHNITSLTFSNNNLINNIDVSGNNLPDADIDALLNEVNSYGTSNGTINYSNQTGGGVPTAIGSGTAYNNLIARGWTLTGANPFGTNISTYSVNQFNPLFLPTVYNWEFNETGDLMFIFSGSNFEKYPLTTPFDISTLGAISQSVNYASSSSAYGQGSQVWDNGNYLFFSVIGFLRRWTFGTPNDLTTIPPFSSIIQSPNFGLSPNFTFNPSGTKCYFLKGTEIDEYTLSTAWNPTTLSFSATKTYASMGLTSIPIPDAQRRLSLRFNSSGTLAIITMGTSVGTTALAYEMSLSTAFDITTMSYSGNTLDMSDSTDWVNKVGADSNLTKIIPLYLQLTGYPSNSTEFKEWS